MAARYWVGDGGNWNDTSQWSTSSGGSSGASVPTTADDVFIDANSFSTSGQAITRDVTAECLSIDATGLDQAIDIDGSSDMEVGSDCILNANVTFTGGGDLDFILTANGDYNLNGADYSDWQYFHLNTFTLTLLSDANSTLHQMDGSTGVLDLNGFTYTTNNQWNHYSGHLLFSSGTVVTPYYDIGSGVVDSGPGTVYINGGDFRPNGVTHPSVVLDYPTNTVNVASTFSVGSLTITANTTITFQAARTVTVTEEFIAVGTSGNEITISSSTAATHTLDYDGAGVVECDYLILSYSITTPSDTWYAGSNSTDSGNNTGWLFEDAPSGDASITESASITEAQTAQSVLNDNTNESASVDDITDASKASAGAVLESASIDDAPTVQAELNDSVSESASITEAQTADEENEGATAESASISDTPTAQAELNDTVSESASITEAQTGEVEGAGSGTTSESVSIDDAPTVQAELSDSVLESLSISDTCDAQLVAAVDITESLAIEAIQTVPSESVLSSTPDAEVLLTSSINIEILMSSSISSEVFL